MWVMPLAAAIIGTTFAGFLLRYYLAGRGPFLLAWSFALMLLGVAAACAFIGSIDAWTELTAKVYYLAAAALFTAFMSLGSVYFNAMRIIGHVWLGVVLLSAAAAAYLLSGATVDLSVQATSPEPGWQAIETAGAIVGIVVALSSIGTAILVAAAIYSLVLRKAALAQVAVAVGVLLVAVAGSLGRLDAWEWIFIGQLPGMVLIFAGALMANSSGQASGGKATQ